MKKKVGVIDNFDSFVFNLVRYLHESDVETIVMRNDAIDYDQLETCDGILLSPGPGIPGEAGELMACIEKYVNHKNMLGVCLGHQALGEFFGAKLKQEKKPIHGESSFATQILDDDLLLGIDSPFQVGRYHSWSVEIDSSSDIKPSSFSEDGCIMSLKHVSLPIHGLQFHPESILTPAGRIMIQNWVKLL